MTHNSGEGACLAPKEVPQPVHERFLHFSQPHWTDWLVLEHCCHGDGGHFCGQCYGTVAQCPVSGRWRCDQCGADAIAKVTEDAS